MWAPASWRSGSQGAEALARHDGRRCGALGRLQHHSRQRPAYSYSCIPPSGLPAVAQSLHLTPANWRLGREARNTVL